MTRFTFYCTIFFYSIIFSCDSPKIYPETSTDFIKAGDSLSKRIFDTLNKTMSATLATGNYEKAILVCKKLAPGLTVSYNNQQAKIRRTSDKIRNENNAPDFIEKQQIEHFKELEQTGLPMKSKLVVDEKGTVHYFGPIILQPLCLNCHGSAETDILPATFAMLKAQYPRDSAIGYKTGDLRGLWHITFNPFTKKL